jgi:hypothetical protein
MDISLGRFDVPALCTRRSDLLDVLLSGLPQTKGADRIHFAEGISSEHDFLIAAVGIRFTWYGTANTGECHANSPESRKRELMEMFAGWHKPIAELISATDEGCILKNGAYDLAPLKR